MNETILSASDQWTGPCPRCGAVALGHWPHPDGQPCPLAEDEHEREQGRRDEANRAYIEQLQATRDYYDRGCVPSGVPKDAWGWR